MRGLVCQLLAVGVLSGSTARCNSGGGGGAGRGPTGALVASSHTNSALCQRPHIPQRLGYSPVSVLLAREVGLGGGYCDTGFSSTWRCSGLVGVRV